MNRLYLDDFHRHFKDDDIFETSDIADFYHSMPEQLTLSTINWRIYSLIQRGILQRVGRGKFRTGKTQVFIPDIPLKLKSLYRKIDEKFPFTNICVWHTSVFNEFMHHQAGRFYYLIEVEREAVEALFYALKELNVFALLNPNQEVLDKYAPENRDAYIIKPLTSETPLQTANGIVTVTLEKILVDIFSDETLFAAQQGAEMRIIFNEAFQKYTINQSKLLRYADRRKKRADLTNYLKTISNYRQQNTFGANL
jgi:hypothetical protein